MEKRRPPPRRSFARVQRLPFTALHCKTRGVSCSRRQTPRRVEKRRPPRAVLLSRVQRSPFRWTYHKPAPFSCSRRPKPQHRQDRRGGAASKRRPNIDNVDNMDTTARRVEATQARGANTERANGRPLRIENGRNLKLKMNAQRNSGRGCVLTYNTRQRETTATR